MGTLIDSSVLVEAERGRLDLNAKVAAYPGEVFSIAAISVAEMLHGLRRSVGPKRQRQREGLIHYVLTTFPVLPFDLGAARVHARVGADLAVKGVRVGKLDLIIAATAIANGMQVATRDLRSFHKIPGLVVVQW